MNAAKKGYVAEFVTGYLQREIRKMVKVAGGTDEGLRDGALGIAVGRLVKLTGDTIEPVTPTAVSLDGATHIIAQSDDTIREVPSDYNYTERYSYLPNLVVKNSDELKTVALYKIVNVDDIKLMKIAEPINVLTAIKSSNAFVVGPATFMFKQTGINAYKVVGTAPHVSSPIVSGNPAGNYLYFKIVNTDITTQAAYNAALNEMASDAIVYKRISGIGENTENKSTIASEINSNGGIEVEACINSTKTLTIEVMYANNEFTTITFDLTNLTMEANA